MQAPALKGGDGVPTVLSQGFLGVGSWGPVHHDTGAAPVALAPLESSFVSLGGVCLFSGPERRERFILFKGLCN